jgi:phage-related protein
MTTLTYVPSYSTEVDTEPRVDLAQFGDGYAQRAADGINNMPEKWNLVYENVDITTSNAIIAFFKALGGYIAFDWTPPDGVAGRYVATSWKRTYAGYNSRNVTVMVVQDFAP